MQTGPDFAARSCGHGARHRESEHKRRPMPVIPKLCDTYLSRPFSKEKILDTLATQDHPFMSGVVGIDMSDIFTDRWDYNYDAFMDELSMRLTDTDKLTHIKYKIKSYDEDTNQLLIWVEDGAALMFRFPVHGRYQFHLGQIAFFPFGIGCLLKPVFG